MADGRGIPLYDSSIKERWTHKKALLVTFLLPLFIGLFGPSLTRIFDYIFWAAAIFLPGVILAAVIYDWLGNSKSIVRAFLKHIHPLPAGIITGTDLKINSMPWATLLLVASNTFLFLALPTDTVESGLFFPPGKPTFLHVAVSFFFSAFLHADFSHLFGNMVFLWVFGAVLEPRLGSGRFLLAYLAGIVVSNTFCVILLFFQAISLGDFKKFWDYHSLGASGAISGLMGLFAVRAYFAKIKITVPFLYIPFLSFALPVQAAILIGMFFCMDVAGGLRQFSEAAKPGVDYWAHVGGYMGGIAIGYLIKLHRDAACEASEVNAERLANKTLLKKEAAGAWQEILARDPQNEKALQYFCRLYWYNAEKRAPYLGRLFRVLQKRDFCEALSLFESKYPGCLQSISGDVLLKFGLHFLRTGEFMKASSCLKTASEKQGVWQSKALYSLADAYEERDWLDLAADTLEKVITLFPDSPFGRVAQDDLRKLERSGKHEDHLKRKEARLLTP